MRHNLSDLREVIKDRRSIKPENFKRLEGVSFYEAGGLYRYTYGSESSWESASTLQKEVVEKGYHDAFDNLNFEASAWLPGSDENGMLDGSVSTYGTWTGTHTATGATIYNKWYAVIAFNEDGKVVMFSDWMDVSGMQAQIEAHVATQTE